MKRLLCIVGGMNMGGAETFLMKIYRAIDRDRFQMDFAVASAEPGDYDDEIRKMGGKIFKITPKTRGLWRNLRDIASLVRRERYKAVLRVSQHSLSALELMAAAAGGARVRAFRSSNSDPCAGAKSRWLHRVCRFMPRRFANVRIAPSSEAARFMFGEKWLDNGKVKILKNAIPFETYRFNPDARSRIRKELGVGNALAIGHVGRFSNQKNHAFLIDVFSELKKSDPGAKFILVGDGELREQVRELATRRGLGSDVVFAGLRKDVAEFYSAFDAMVFPSLFEGMPNTVIEAQAAGLPCLVSDTVTPECRLTEAVGFLSLSQPARVWAEKALEATARGRLDTEAEFRKSGYDIGRTADEFVSLVFESYEDYDC